MGLGILEPRQRAAPVPGTEIFNSETEDSLPHHLALPGKELQVDRKGNQHVVLIPQPTGHRDDPLNWSLCYRDFVTGVLCIASILAGTLGPLIAAMAIRIWAHWRIGLTEVALLTGYHLAGVGVCGFFVVPTARVWGKRHHIVLGSVLLVATSLWGGLATTYKSFLWARILQGAAVAPFEALVNASIGDMYCVHERGTRMAFATFALFGGAFITPVIVGKMAFDMHSWRWPFIFVAIFSSLVLPLVILFVPETAFRRDGKHVSTPSVHTETTDSDVASKYSPAYTEQITEEESRRFFVPRRMRLFNGRKTDDKLWILLLRPIALLFHPAIFWGMITQGVMIGWTVMIGCVIGKIFALRGEVVTGNMYGGAFVGALLGLLLAGMISDWSVNIMARRNNGIYEPEFRILLVIPQMIIGLIGLFGFGWTTEHMDNYSEAVPSFFFGLQVMGVVLGATASALYLYEAYKELAVESFTALLLFKNFFSFALTYKSFDWLAERGTWLLHRDVALVQVVVCLSSVPMYIYGKRLRAWWAKAELLRKMGLDLQRLPQK